MRKFLMMGAAALLVAILSIQQVRAWVNFKTGIGANIAYQSGGNNLLWGVFGNGQPCGPEANCGFPLPGCEGAAAPGRYYAAPGTPASAPARHLHAVTPGQTTSGYNVPSHRTGASGYSVYSPYYSPRR